LLPDYKIINSVIDLHVYSQERSCFFAVLGSWTVGCVLCHIQHFEKLLLASVNFELEPVL